MILRREPADPQACHRECLRHDADRDRSVVEVGARGQRGRAVVLEEAVHLVGDQADPAGAALGGETPPLLLGGQHPGRLVRCVHDDHPRLVVQRADEPVDIEPPAVASAAVQPDLRARGPRHLVQRLVARPGHDYVVARVDRRAHEAEDRLLGAGEDHHVVRREALVQLRDLGPEQRMAGRLRVAELQPVPHRAGLVVRERQELGHRPASTSLRARDVLDGELPPRITDDGEIGHAHERMMRPADLIVRGPVAGCAATLPEMPIPELAETIAMVGSPTALGGHFPGMDGGPQALRQMGFLERLQARKGLAGMPIMDNGDAPSDAGWAADDDPFMKNRQRIREYMPRLIVHVHRALGGKDAATTPPRC